VALDRQTIERKDFPIGRRGYDPDAVDAHLSALAEQVDELKRSSRRRSESLAAAASEQVRSIVEAAETSASEIQRQAEDEAREIRAEASSEAQTTREQATSQAREYVGNVSESTGTMLQRLDAMQNELNALFEALRTGSNRLNADLQLLETNLEEARDAVAPRPRFEPEPQAPVQAAGAASPTTTARAPVDDRPGSEPGLGAPAHGDTLAEPPASSATAPSPATAPPDGPEDPEGARLIALNMALDRKPREETERYLAENFRLSDLRGLVEEVYASVRA
jgi:DivIVA domain-containing protein